jgi:Methylamine utilisation protein MauE
LIGEEMPVLQFTLEIYFAATLGIAGVAKLDNISSFVRTLRQQYSFPQRSADILGNVFPWLELFLALSLLIPAFLYRCIAVFSTFALFCVFLICHLFIIRNGHSRSGCGCYGEVTPKQNDVQSLVTLVIQLASVLLLAFITLLAPSFSWQYYLAGFILLVGFYSWLIWKIRVALMPKLGIKD